MNFGTPPYCKPTPCTQPAGHLTPDFSAVNDVTLVVGNFSLNCSGIYWSTSSLEGHIGISFNFRYKKFTQVMMVLLTVAWEILYKWARCSSGNPCLSQHKVRKKILCSYHQRLNENTFLSLSVYRSVRFSICVLKSSICTSNGYVSSKASPVSCIFSTPASMFWFIPDGPAVSTSLSETG